MGEQFDMGFCLGKIGAVKNLIGMIKYEDEKMKPCLPEKGLTNEQAIRTVVAFLKCNPHQLHQESEEVLILVAFMRAYPCK